MAVGPRLGDILSDLAVELQASEWEDGASCSTRLAWNLPSSTPIRSPSPAFVQNSDCDDIPRKRPRVEKCAEERVVTLVHTGCTSLDDVGQQLWRGALLMADLLVERRNELDGCTILELGCGVGLLGIVMKVATCDATVVLTDRDDAILDFARRNVRANSHLESFCGARGTEIYVRELDWLGVWPGDNRKNIQDTPEKGDWSTDDLRNLDKIDFILAADCIYDEALTDGFFACLQKLLRVNPKAKAWVALEKRFNFELASLSVQANGYRRFLHHLGLAYIDGALTSMNRKASDKSLLLHGRQMRVEFPK